MVDLPLPDCPTKARVCPFLTSNETLDNTFSLSYLNETLSNFISEEKFKLETAFGALVIELVVSKTDITLSAAAFPRFTLYEALLMAFAGVRI